MRLAGLAIAFVALCTFPLAGCGGAPEEEEVDETASESDALTTWSDAHMQHDLAVVNHYRKAHGRRPLVLARKLCDFAKAGSKELMRDHQPHAHFMAAARSGAIWSDGFRTSAGENQGDPNGWPKAPEDTQIDQILKAMMDEGPGKGEAHGHYENLMNPKFTRLGVGLVEDAHGMLYLTNDFSD